MTSISALLLILVLSDFEFVLGSKASGHKASVLVRKLYKVQPTLLQQRLRNVWRDIPRLCLHSELCV